MSETSELHRQLLASLEAHLRSRHGRWPAGHGPWARQERTTTRRAVVEMAEELERRVVEARTQDRRPGEVLG